MSEKEPLPYQPTNLVPPAAKPSLQQTIDEFLHLHPRLRAMLDTAVQQAGGHGQRGPDGK